MHFDTVQDLIGEHMMTKTKKVNNKATKHPKFPLDGGGVNFVFPDGLWKKSYQKKKMKGEKKKKNLKD